MRANGNRELDKRLDATCGLQGDFQTGFGKTVNKAIPRILAVCGPQSPELSSQADGQSPLGHLCKAFGHRVAAYAVGNLDELTRSIGFLGAIAYLPGQQPGPLVVHISVDGDSGGMEIGPDKAPWNRLTETLSKLFVDLESYADPIVLVLATRGAGETEFSGVLTQRGDPTTPFPRHRFRIVEQTPRWVDSMVLWSLFYGEVTEIDFSAHCLQGLPNLRRLDTRLQQLGLGSFSYFGTPTAPPSNPPRTGEPPNADVR